jgi:RNA polymerase sigma factor (sigma-70 family)
VEIATVAIQREKKVSEWFASYGKRLLSFISKRVGDIEEAEDIAQDVWLQVSRHPNIDDIEEIGSWLFTSARNRVIDNYRKKRPLTMSKIGMHTDNDGEEGGRPDEIYFDQWAGHTLPDRTVESKEFWRELYRVLDTLPQEQRDVFIANELYDISFKEMAAESGHSINTLLARKRYAVLHLRKHFEHWRK